MTTTYEHPRILVIARRDAFHGWIKAMGDAVLCVTPNTNIFGRTFDLILVDVAWEDMRRHQTREWIEEAVMSRLNPDGKYLEVR